ncbi:hypothetical protein BOX15_Mlig023634g2, partial [Macrostomum lignano]
IATQSPSMSPVEADEEEVQDILESWLTLQSTKEEVESLQRLADCLCHPSQQKSAAAARTVENGSDSGDSDDPAEAAFLRASSMTSTTTSWTLDDVRRLARRARLSCRLAEDLDWLAFYLFDRRFGWPDLREEDGGLLLVTRPEAQGRTRRSGKQEELRHKQALIRCLDSLIEWLTGQQVSAMSVKMMASAARIALDTPVTRYQLTLHSFDWLRERLHRPDEATFAAVCELASQAVSDVWSQIRGSAVSRLGPIVDRLSLVQIQQLFDELARLCHPMGNSWQATEGGISGLNAIIKRFQRVGCSPGDLSLSSSSSTSGLSPRMNSQIKIGPHVLDKLPMYVYHKTKMLAFELVTDEQLTTRETAVKAFVNCLACCSDQESELAFHEVYQRLSSCLGSEDLLECPVQSESFSFMEPYCAESLLNLCLQLFKRIRDHQSYLQNWDIYHRVFDVYLMHPASSVRQAASNLYKYVVARSVSSPLLVKNILYCLMRKWTPDQATLLRPIDQVLREKLSARQAVRPSTGDEEREFERESDTWEWREGRLMVCELVCKLLLKNHSLCVTTGGRGGAGGTGGGGVGGKSQSCNAGGGHRKPGKSQHPQQLNNSRGRCSMSESDGVTDEFLSLRERLNLGRRSSQSEVPAFPPSHRLDPIEAGQVLNFVSPVSFLVQVNRIDSPGTPTPPSSPAGGGGGGGGGIFSTQQSTSSSSQQQLPSFRSLLCLMLHTCAESLADGSWELRRMGRQAFVAVGQLLLAYDRRLFEHTVSTHLRYEPSVMTFCVLWMVRDALLAQTRMQQQQQQQQLEIPAAWLTSCRHYLTEFPLNCVSVHAADVLFLAAQPSALPAPDAGAIIGCLRAIDATLAGGGDVEVELTLLTTLSVTASPADFLLTLLEACAPRLTAFAAVGQLDCAGRLLPLCLGWLRIVGRGGRGQRRTSAGFTVGGVVGILTASSAAAVTASTTDSVEAGRLLLNCVAVLAERIAAIGEVKPGHSGSLEEWTAATALSGEALERLADLMRSEPSIWLAYRRHLMSAVRCLLPIAAIGCSLSPGDAPSGRTAAAAASAAASIDSLVAAAASQLVKLPDVGSSQKSASNGPADKASQMRASKRRQFKLYASQSTVHSDDASDNSDNQGSDISDGEDSVYNPIASLCAGNNGFDRTSRQRVISNCLTEDEAEDSSSEAAASDWDSSSVGDSDPGRPADPRVRQDSSEQQKLGLAFLSEAREIFVALSRAAPERLVDSAARLKPEERLRVEAMAAAREAAGEPETQL